MLPVLQLGPMSISTPGLALLLGLWGGLEVASRLGKARGMDDDAIYSVWFNALLVAVLSARLGFVLLNLGLYRSIEPFGRFLRAVFSLVPGTENALIGLAVGAGVLIWSARRKDLDLLDLLDVSTAGAVVLMLGVGLSHFLAGTWYGTPTSLPWAIPLWGADRHPTQVYIMLAMGGVLYLLLRMNASAQAEGYTPGFMTQIGVLLIGLVLMLIEPLRADSATILDGVRVGQVIGLGLIAASLVGFILRADGAAPGEEIKEAG